MPLELPTPSSASGPPKYFLGANMPKRLAILSPWIASAASYCQTALATLTCGANFGLYNGGVGTTLATARTTGQGAGTLVARFTF